MSKEIIVLIGLPGSGKGTQGQFISNYLDIPHISTGDILREMVTRGGNEAKELSDYMDKGLLVPSELINKIVLKYLNSEICVKGCVLDGYPRSLQQAQYLDENCKTNLKILYFEISDDLAVNRVLNRLNCAKCGAVYNKSYDMPADGICNNCGEDNFVSRKDDNLDAYKARLESYKSETIPVIEYYKKENYFFAIDGEQSKDKVQEDILKLIKKI